MTEIAFHFGAPNKLEYVCRLLRKAVASGSNAVVLAEPDLLQQVDSGIWALSPTDFVPHCDASADQMVLERSPVLLVSHLDQASPALLQLLVNLSDSVPQGFEKFQRLIEVVSTDEQDRDLARRRWKHYAAQGFEIVRHDLALRGAS